MTTLWLMSIHPIKIKIDISITLGDSKPIHILNISNINHKKIYCGGAQPGGKVFFYPIRR